MAHLSFSYEHIFVIILQSEASWEGFGLERSILLVHLVEHFEFVVVMVNFSGLLFVQSVRLSDLTFGHLGNWFGWLGDFGLVEIISFGLLVIFIVIFLVILFVVFFVFAGEVSQLLHVHEE